jgi:hypothetical protein
MKIDLGCCGDRPIDRDRRVEHPCPSLTAAMAAVIHSATNNWKGQLSLIIGGVRHHKTWKTRWTELGDWAIPATFS